MDDFGKNSPIKSSRVSQELIRGDKLDATIPIPEAEQLAFDSQVPRADMLTENSSGEIGSQIRANASKFC